MKAKQPSISYEVIMLVLSFLALGAMGFNTLGRLDEQTGRILNWLDFAVCLVFFGDFCRALYRAPVRWKYFVTWGWLDLISSIPMVDVFRWGRFARIFRIVRLLRGFKATKILSSFVLRRRVGSMIAVTSLLVVIFGVFSAIAVLQVETDPSSNIRNAEDAVWWVASAITTGGSNDYFPVTTAGRIVGLFLMVIGIGLFGAMSGFVASWMLSPIENKEETEIASLRKDVQELSQLVRDSLNK